MKSDHPANKMKTGPNESAHPTLAKGSVYRLTFGSESVKNMKVISVCVLLAIGLMTPHGVKAGTIFVSHLKAVPKHVVAFTNDLYANEKASKELIQLFLSEGTLVVKLSSEFVDESKEVLSPFDKDIAAIPPPSTYKTKLSDGELFLEDCRGVFTDGDGVVYYWFLRYPRVLEITSQNYESGILLLKQPRYELMRLPHTPPANAGAVPAPTVSDR